MRPNSTLYRVARSESEHLEVEVNFGREGDGLVERGAPSALSGADQCFRPIKHRSHGSFTRILAPCSGHRDCHVTNGAAHPCSLDFLFYKFWITLKCGFLIRLPMEHLLCGKKSSNVSCSLCATFSSHTLHAFLGCDLIIYTIWILSTLKLFQFATPMLM